MIRIDQGPIGPWPAFAGDFRAAVAAPA